MNPQDETTIERLKEVLHLHYRLEPAFIDKSSWGYNSTAYYVKDASGEEYMAKVTRHTTRKEKELAKEVYVNNYLAPHIPTSQYYRNKNDTFITIFDDKLVRLAKFIPGATAFKMNFAILREVITILEKIHQVDVAGLEYPLEKLPTTEPKLLHGDLTASNILVVGDTITGVLDFEEALIGPVEYDLARSAVFCWFRMEEVPFSKVFEFFLETYSTEGSETRSADRKNAGNAINIKLFRDFCILHASKHLDQIVKNEPNYHNKEFWQDDYNFSAQALEEIKNTGQALS